tara:strand:- start:45 stop:344 length:300 start_codon:yes stop_codon:yes gene_type:complete
MIKLIKIVKSTNPKKKFDAFFMIDGKERKKSFGARGMDDYTLTKDKEQRKRYRTRHRKDLLTPDNKKGIGAGALSYYILWGDSTDIKKNISAYKKRFNV